MKAIKDIALGL